MNDLWQLAAVEFADPIQITGQIEQAVGTFTPIDQVTA